MLSSARTKVFSSTDQMVSGADRVGDFVRLSSIRFRALHISMYDEVYDRTAAGILLEIPELIRIGFLVIFILHHAHM